MVISIVKKYIKRKKTFKKKIHTSESSRHAGLEPSLVEPKQRYISHRLGPFLAAAIVAAGDGGSLSVNRR